MEIEFEKIPNAKGYKLIITFIYDKEVYTVIKSKVSKSTIKDYKTAWRHCRRLDNSIYPSLWRIYLLISIGTFINVSLVVRH